MWSVSDRLRRRIERDFPVPGSAASVVEMSAFRLLRGRGDLDRLRDAGALAERDWRDVLVRADQPGVSAVEPNQTVTTDKLDAIDGANSSRHPGANSSCHGQLVDLADEHR
jgi:hypothetical protein